MHHKSTHTQSYTMSLKMSKLDVTLTQLKLQFTELDIQGFHEAAVTSEPSHRVRDLCIIWITQEMGSIKDE